MVVIACAIEGRGIKGVGNFVYDGNWVEVVVFEAH